MDFHRTKYRFLPVNYLASRTKDARSIYSNRELKVLLRRNFDFFFFLAFRVR